MTTNQNPKTEIHTVHGTIHLEGPMQSEQLQSLTMNDCLSNFRQPDRQKEALLLVANAPEGLVYIARNKQEIIGYVIFHYPHTFSRWSKHPRIMELGAIEVSQTYKKLGIATNLLRLAFQNPIMEEYIVISTEFFWHWDLKNSGLNVLAYQKMLAKLFGTVHFRKRRTDDPDILEHPANMLMVRFGSAVNQTYCDAFEALTYQKSLVD